MRFRKAILLVGLGSFLLAPQFAKATVFDTTILFNDTTDTLSFSSTSGRVTPVPFACPAVTSTAEICKIVLAAPTATATVVTTGTTVPALYLIAESTNMGVLGTPISDLLATANTPLIAGSPVTFEFDSDLSTLEGTVALGICPFGGCNAGESGQPQTVGTITWSDGTVDTIQFASDSPVPGEVPEPASLILLGSGLAITGGFLRRRRRGACFIAVGEHKGEIA